MKFDYEDFYEEAPVGFFTSNSLGVIIHANSYFLELVDYNIEDIVDKKGLQDFLPIGGKIYFQTHYFPLLKMEGKVKEVNFEIVQKDKTRVPVLVNTHKSGQSGDEPVYHSVVFKISQRSLFEKELIAERKRAENLTEELKKTNEKIVAQAEIITNQNASLDRLNGIKDKFFSVVAHDIKAPLNNLLSFVYVLQTPIENDDLQGFKSIIDKIGQSIFDTIDLADNLLHWAQTQMIEYGVSPSTFKLEELLNEVIENQLPSAERKDISISCHIDGLESVFVDKNHLNFILGNLLSNAVKFTPNNGKISIEASKNEQGDLIIAVTDSGVGMSKEYMESIFLEDKKTTRVGTQGEKGNGIGLVLVKEFVTMNKGTIQVSSEVDKGTTFLITLKSVN